MGFAWGPGPAVCFPPMPSVERQPGRFFLAPDRSHRDEGTGWAGWWRFHWRDGPWRRRTTLALAAPTAGPLVRALRAGAHPDMRLCLGSYPHDTLLGWAVLNQRHRFARVLLAAGANPNLPSGPHRRTPLHQAAVLDDERMCRLLVARGARWDGFGLVRARPGDPGRWTSALHEARGTGWFAWARQSARLQEARDREGRLESALETSPPARSSRPRL